MIDGETCFEPGELERVTEYINEAEVVMLAGFNDLMSEYEAEPEANRDVQVSNIAAISAAAIAACLIVTAIKEAKRDPQEVLAQFNRVLLDKLRDQVELDV